MSNYLYGLDNTVKNSGSYYLEPPLLGLGPASAEVESTDGNLVTANITLLGLLDLPIAAAATYTITADANTSVTVTASSVSALTYTVLNASGGTVAIAGGLLDALSGVTVNITNGGTFSGTGIISAASGMTINFGSGGGTLNLAGSSTGLALLSGASINGFSAGDQIIINADGTTATITGVSYNSLTGDSTVTFSNGDSVVLTGEYTDQPNGTGIYLQTEAVSNGVGTELSATCFCAGTLIRTDRGEVVVENLRIGDLVETMHASFCPVRWIGRRAYAGRFIANNHLMLPVTLKAGAIADDVPARDLVVSPGHALWVDGLLIPAWRLVNGASIVQAESVASVEYFHVELDSHEVLFAEGTPAESFFDDDCRRQFENVASFVEGAKGAPIPRCEFGFALQAIQMRLAARAGLPARSIGSQGGLRGFVDVAGPEVVAGWAQDVLAPEAPVALDILVDGRRVCRVLANQYRADLRAAGLGSGCHAFSVPVAAAGRVEVHRAVDQAELVLAQAAQAA